MSHEEVQRSIMRRSHDRAPAFHGRCKPGSLSNHEVRVLRPQGYEDTAFQLKEIEKAGKMTPELASYGQTILSGLKDAKDSGAQKDVDYYWKEHPQFEGEPQDVPIIEE